MAASVVTPWLIQVLYADHDSSDPEDLASAEEKHGRFVSFANAVVEANLPGLLEWLEKSDALIATGPSYFYFKVGERPDAWVQLDYLAHQLSLTPWPESHAPH